MLLFFLRFKIKGIFYILLIYRLESLMFVLIFLCYYFEIFIRFYIFICKDDVVGFVEGFILDWCYVGCEVGVYWFLIILEDMEIEVFGNGLYYILVVGV